MPVTHRMAFTLMSVASLGVLAGIFYSRGKLAWAAGFVLLAVIYLMQALIRQRREIARDRAERIAGLVQEQTPAGKQAILDDLLATRNHLKGARVRETGLGMVLVIAIILAQPANLPLAMALAVGLVPISVLVVRHTRAINKIESGLADRGLLPGR